MCVPCSKEVINKSAVLFAQLAETVRRLSLLDPVEISEEQDNFLYRMAEREIESITSVKESAVEMSRMQGSPPRWIKLMERL